jgi:hypothetical protein
MILSQKQIEEIRQAYPSLMESYTDADVQYAVNNHMNVRGVTYKELLQEFKTLGICAQSLINQGDF